MMADDDKATTPPAPIIPQTPMQSKVVEFVKSMPMGGMAVAFDRDEATGKTRMVSSIDVKSGADMSLMVQYFLLMCQEACKRAKDTMRHEVLSRIIRYWVNNVPETLH